MHIVLYVIIIISQIIHDQLFSLLSCNVSKEENKYHIHYKLLINLLRHINDIRIKESENGEREREKNIITLKIIEIRELP